MQRRNTIAGKSFILLFIFFLAMPGCGNRHVIYSMGTYVAIERELQDSLFPRATETAGVEHIIISPDTQLILTDTLATYIEDACSDRSCFVCTVINYVHGDAALAGHIHADHQQHHHTEDGHMHRVRIPRAFRMCLLFFLFIVFI